MEYVRDDQELEEAPTERVLPVVPYYSAILIGCIVVVSIFQIATDLRDSVVLGGFINSLFLEGQYWRIMTSATLHGGLMHLAFNSYALFVLGRLMEMLSNRSHLPIVFLLSVIGGGLMSFAFGPDVPSVGASGGIIGFLGYLTVYGYRRRRLLSNSFLKSMLFNIVLIAAFGLFVIPNVDNFAHLGGLLVGAAYGFIAVPSDLHEDPRIADKTTIFIGYIALGIFVLTSIFSILLLSGIISFNNNII